MKKSIIIILFFLITSVFLNNKVFAEQITIFVCDSSEISWVYKPSGNFDDESYVIQSEAACSNACKKEFTNTKGIESFINDGWKVITSFPNRTDVTVPNIGGGKCFCKGQKIILEREEK